MRWKKFTHFFPLYWASVVRTNCIFGCLGSMCVTVEHVAVEEHVQYVHVSCTEMWWGGILALDPDWSCSWERKHQDKTGEESTSSVPLTLFWLMLKRYVGYFHSVCVCMCVSLCTNVLRHMYGFSSASCCPSCNLIGIAYGQGRARRLSVSTKA